MSAEKPPVQIVDQDDNIIGHKPRHEIDYDTDTFRSSCLWLENSDGEVLIAQRKLTKDKDPGKWGPAASGTIDEGETYEGNIVKEAKEEIGLTDVEPRPVTKLLRSAPRKEFVSVFSAIVDKPVDEFVLQEEEVEQVAWIPKEELRRELEETPQKYVDSMKQLMELFE